MASSKTLKIEARSLSIAKLFDDFYVVPSFQREFVWQKEHVENLLEDITYVLYDDKTPIEDAEYFLGSIVVFPDGQDNKFQVIDGQQRLTSIFLIFCAINSLFVQLGHSFEPVKKMIRDITQDQTGEQLELFRLELQYGNAFNFLKDIAKGEPEKNWSSSFNKRSLSSTDRLIDAYNVIKDFLGSFFIRRVEKISSTLHC